MGRREEIGRGDATAQAALVRTKAVQPMEVVEAASERSERVNPALHAGVTPRSDQAWAARGPIPAGPFAGVPLLMKDFLAEVAGVRFTEGLPSSRTTSRPRIANSSRGTSGPGCSLSARRTCPPSPWGRPPNPSSSARPTTRGTSRAPRVSPAGGAAAAVDGSKRSALPGLDDPHA